MLGFRNEHPDNESLNGTPDDEDDVELPLDVLQGDGVSELVDQHGSGKRQIREGHALSAHLEGQDFDGVKSL